MSRKSQTALGQPLRLAWLLERCKEISSSLKAFELLKWAAKVIKLRDLKSPKDNWKQGQGQFSVGASRHAGRPDLSRHWSKNHNDVVKENNRPEPATMVKLNSTRTEISCNIFKQHRG